MKPVIGITPSASTDTLSHGSFYRYNLASTYVDAVRAANGIPILLPSGESELEHLIDLVDGLVFSGGADIDPALFGESVVHPKTYGIDAQRDETELALYQLAVKRDLPTLAICRGIQVMNVALGGTLIQDIADLVPGEIGHRQHQLGRSQTETSHDVSIIATDNPLAQIIGRPNLMVNSYHHQSVADPAPGLEVIATSSDGVIEALWHPDMRFGLGVQWHPEMLAADHAAHAALFSALVEAAAAVPTTR